MSSNIGSNATSFGKCFVIGRNFDDKTAFIIGIIDPRQCNRFFFLSCNFQLRRILDIGICRSNGKRVILDMGITVIGNRNGIGRIILIHERGRQLHTVLLTNTVAIGIEGFISAIKRTRTAMRQIPLGRNTIGRTFFPE